MIEDFFVFAGDQRCSETWDGMRRLFYGFFTSITQFVLPFSTVIFCYTAIIRRLSNRTNLRPGLRSAQREELERARNLKTNRMLISMVIVFGICWIPLNTINFIADLDLFPVFCWEYSHFVFFIAHLMAMSSTCYNPFLYGWHNESFQKEFVKMIPFLRGFCGQSGSLRQDANDVGMTTNAGLVGEKSVLTRYSPSLRRKSSGLSASAKSRLRRDSSVTFRGDTTTTTPTSMVGNNNCTGFSPTVIPPTLSLASSQQQPLSAVHFNGTTQVRTQEHHKKFRLPCCSIVRTQIYS